MFKMEGSSYLISVEEDRSDSESPSNVSSSDTIKENDSFKNSANELPRNDNLDHSVSISMPVSPIGTTSARNKSVFFLEPNDENDFAESDTSGPLSNDITFHSQPLPKGGPIDLANITQLPSIRFRDKRYDSFKTWSGKLERQISNLRRKPQEQEPDEILQENSDNHESFPLPVDRYFDALQGPELDTLRPSEEIMLPLDKLWPFLLRFPISSFGICLGVSSQAIMWKALATTPSTNFLHISLKVNLVLWCISLALVASVSSIYLCKVIFYFEAVRREYYHPIRVNFFFAPWVALLFLCQGAPPFVAKTLPQPLWYVLMTPILILELKIYGQWMSGGQRRLSKVANPSNHLSIVGNFVGALLGATMGLKEGPIFFFAVGLAHYTVLFVTLYQRLPTNATLPKELHPVFFLFVAAPSVASMAWAKIEGSFTHGSRIAYFIALFLYFSLAVRINFFRGFKFSLAWWAYTFPMTGAAIATIRYSSEHPNVVKKALSVLLSATATLTVTALLVSTIVHAFVIHDLFPNDMAIAISNTKPKPLKKWFHRRNWSAENIRDNIEHFFKFSSKEGTPEDVESGSGSPAMDRN